MGFAPFVEEIVVRPQDRLVDLTSPACIPGQQLALELCRLSRFLVSHAGSWHPELASSQRRVWSKYSNAHRASSLRLSKGRLNPPSRSDTYFSSAEGVAMDWKTMLSYISGSVDEVCLLFRVCLLFIHPGAPNLISLRSAGTMPA